MDGWMDEWMEGRKEGRNVIGIYGLGTMLSDHPGHRNILKQTRSTVCLPMNRESQ